MLNTVLLLLIICWLLYIEYKILRRVNDLEKKVNNVSFVSRQQINTVARTLIIYLKEKNVFNERQEKLLNDEIEKIHLKSERQLEGVYKSELDEIFKSTR